MVWPQIHKPRKKKTWNTGNWQKVILRVKRNLAYAPAFHTLLPKVFTSPIRSVLLPLISENQRLPSELSVHWLPFEKAL
jgi:hypothetical protein